MMTKNQAGGYPLEARETGRIIQLTTVLLRKMTINPGQLICRLKRKKKEASVSATEKHLLRMEKRTTNINNRSSSYAPKK